jgi:hypothetical protein
MIPRHSQPCLTTYRLPTKRPIKLVRLLAGSKWQKTVGQGLVGEGLSGQADQKRAKLARMERVGGAGKPWDRSSPYLALLCLGA